MVIPLFLFLLQLGEVHSLDELHPAEDSFANQEASRPSGSETGTHSRVEQRRRLREQRAQEVSPPQIGGFERNLLWLEQQGLDLLGNFNYKRFFPRFGGMPTGSGAAFGTRYWNPNLNSTFFDLQGVASISTLGYQQYELQFGEIPQFGEVLQKSRGFFLHGNLAYRNYSREKFFGVGPESKQEDRTSYRRKQALYEAIAGYRLSPSLYLEGQFGFTRILVGEGTDEDFPPITDLFGEDSAPGLGHQPDFVTLGASLQWDLRDRPGNPHRGNLLFFRATRYETLGDTRFDFSRFEFEGQHYLPLGSQTRVLALRLIASFDATAGGDQTPFYLQRVLGGAEALRGFRESRFQDQHQLLLSGEYRWEAVPALELALFYGAGKVFGRMADFNLRNLRKSVGAGIRLKSSRSVIFRLDVGRSTEGTIVYLRVGSSF